MVGPQTIDLSGARWSGPGVQQAAKEAVDIQKGQQDITKGQADIVRDAALTPAQILKAKGEARLTELQVEEAEAKKQERLRAEAALEASKGDIASKLATQIATLLAAKKLSEEGLFASGFGSSISRIDGSPSTSLAALLGTARSNTAFKELIELDKAGVKLTPVSNVDIGLLAESVAGLDQGQSDVALQQSIDVILAGLGDLYKGTGGTQDLLRNAYEIRTGEGLPKGAVPYFKDLPRAPAEGLSVMPRAADEQGVQVSAPMPGRSNQFEGRPAQEGETLGVSDKNRMAVARLQKAFDEGADVDQLTAMASKLGLGYAPGQLAKGVEYRNWFYSKGGRGPSGVIVAPPETPATAEQISEVEKLNSPIRAGLFKAGEGMSAGLTPAITGLFSPAEAEKQRLASQYFGEASPVLSFLGSAAGSIAPSVLGTMGLVRAGVKPVLAAGITDTLYGATSGAAANPDNPLAGGLTGGAIGATGSLVGNATGSLVGNFAASPAMQKLAQLSGRYMPAKPTFTQRVLSGRMGDADAIIATLREAERLGLPMSVADVSPEARALATQAAKRSGSAADIARNDIVGDSIPGGSYGRGGERLDRLDASIRTNVGEPIADVNDEIRAINAEADDAVSPLYSVALSRAAPVDTELNAMLNTEVGRTGLRQAYGDAEAQGIDPKSLGFDLDAQGNVLVVSKPSWDTLHRVRVGVRNSIDDLHDPLTGALKDSGKQSEVRRYQGFLNRLDERFDKLNPAYTKARKAWSQYVMPRTALKEGYAALQSKTTPAIVQKTLTKIQSMPEGTASEIALKERTMDAYRRGFATAQDEAVKNSRAAGSDPYGVILGSPRQVEKVTMIALNAPDFLKSAELEGQMLLTERALKPAVSAQGTREADSAISGTDLLSGVGEGLISGGFPLVTGGRMLASKAMNPILAAMRFGAPFRAKARATEMAPDVFNTSPGAAADVVENARTLAEKYRLAQLPFQLAGTTMGGLTATAIDRSRDEPMRYDPTPKALDQSTVLATVYGSGAALNGDGSVSLPDGRVVDPDTVRRDVASTVNQITPYYGGQ